MNSSLIDSDASTAADRLTARLREITVAVWSPSNAPVGSVVARLHVARRLTLGLAGAATLIQAIVWLVIAVITGHLDAPWWLWTVVAGGLGAIALTAVSHAYRVATGQHPDQHTAR